jgi:methyltransferase (TIGR00027 family)
MSSEKDNVASTSFLTNFWKYRSNDINYWKEKGIVKGNMTRTKPLFKDKYIEHFASREVEQELAPNVDLQQIADKIDRINPLIFPMHTVRHRYFNKTMSAAVNDREHPAKQVIVLGAGFDTRAIRKRKYPVKFFEVDQAAVLRIKEKIYQAKAIDKNAEYVGIDYVKQDLIKSLESHNIDFNKPTHIIWEGNVFYLPINVVKNIMKDLKTAFKAGFTISFDYYHPRFIEKKTGHADLTTFVETLASMKATFQSGIEDVLSFASETGMKVVNNYKSGELLIEYGIDDNPGNKIDDYRVCTLTSFN